MSAIDGIIRMLEEDAEFEIVDYIKKKSEKINNSPIYSWHDSKNRRIVRVSSGISSETSIVIREYPIGFEKTYYEDRVQMRFKD